MTPLVHLTRRYLFSASHRLHNPVLAEEENHQLYGKCNNPGGHGHNYFLQVCVAGPIDPLSGMVVNLAELDRLVESEVLSRFDETSLNDQPHFRERVPTTENLCVEIFRLLEQEWESVSSDRRARLEAVRLEETSSNFFEYRGGRPHQGPRRASNQ